MSRNYKRLSHHELADELAALEERLAGSPTESRLRNLVQNLRIHQVELEMQNRELREAQRALEEARDRYSDLYDFAPIGYLTLDARGLIREINLTAARKLGRPRTELLDAPFASHLEPGQSQAFFGHLRRTFDDEHRTHVELALRAERGEIRWVSLESVRAHSKGATVCRAAMIDITERRRADQRRQELEARLALVTDNVPVLISYVGADRRYVFNNAAYERWFGHTRDYFRGRHMREVVGSEAYDRIKAYVDKALAGEEMHFEAELAYRDAGSRYVSASYIPHKDQAGAVMGFFVLINDLSERRRAERALVAEREFVSAVLDTAGALIIVMDHQGCIVRFNRECERVTGYTAAEVEGKRFDMLLLPEERSGVEDVFERLSSGDFPNTHENYWLSRDGEPRRIAWSNTALTDQDGRVSHVVATGVDVTEQRRAEEHLRDSERQLRLVTDAVPVLIAYVDRDMRYRFANAAYRDWMGLQPEYMVGRRVDELMETGTFETLEPFARRALDGEAVFYENIIHHRILGRRDVSATLVPDRAADGTVNGYFSVVADITQRKRGEESEKMRLLEAAHTNRLTTMGEMTTEIAHELNQPLTAIATTADICIEHAGRLAGDDSGLLAESLAEISTQAHRAAQIVKHVRTFARRRKPEFAAVKVKDIVDSALSLVRVEARSGGVTIETTFNGGTTVEADAVLVEQLIVNFARNAIEAMVTAGTGEPRLRVTTNAADGIVEIRVSDNGPGLSVAAREHLFEPFYTTKADGMGLGLAICRSIVEAHGGRMWADTLIEGGAEFGFTLNLSNGDKANREPEQ